MTKNRFELDWENDEICNVYDNDIESHISVEEVEELLNNLNNEKTDYYCSNEVLRIEVQRLENENQQLQERNNRQYKQLDNIYHLIEKQDWKTLTGIIQEFQECEEQLQKEWKCYE